MSQKYVDWGYKEQAPKGTAKFILINICYHADDNGKCILPIKKMAQDTNLCVSAVKTNLKKLEQLGLLKIKHRKDIINGIQPNQYELLAVI